jgi:recombination protein RecT
MTELAVAPPQYKQYQAIVSYGKSPEVMEAFSKLLGPDAPHYVQSAILAVQSNQSLQTCTPRSIFSAALRAATLRLSCDPALGHAFIVPYRNKGVAEAKFQPGWKGIQHMALRTGKYRYINTAPIYEGEELIEDRITGEISIEFGAKSQKQIGLIASFALISGFKKTIYMSNEELEEHGRRYSKNYNRSDSLWKTNKDAMYRKTIILKLLRNHGYISPLEAAMLEGDEEGGITDLQLPAEDSVTIIEPVRPKSIAENNALLGYEGDDEAEAAINVEADDFGEPEPVEDQPEPQDDIAETFELEEEPITQADEPLTIEAAYKIQSDTNGKMYGELTISELADRYNALSRSLKDNNLSERERNAKEIKRKAAKLLLDAKKNKEIN